MPWPKKPMIERFLDKIEVEVADDGCWNWTAARDKDGYGVFTGEMLPSGRRAWLRAHRFSYEWFVAVIPNGLEIDHLCRNRSCVNPDHLEPVTTRENQRRGVGTFTNVYGQKTHCPQGHPYDEQNTFIGRRGERVCRICNRDKARRSQRRRRTAARGRSEPPPGHLDRELA